MTRTVSDAENIAAINFISKDLENVQEANKTLDDKSYSLITAVLTYTALLFTASTLLINQFPEVFTPNPKLVICLVIFGILTLLLFMILLISLFSVVTPLKMSRTKVKEFIEKIKNKRDAFFQIAIETNKIMLTEVKRNQIKSERMARARLISIVFFLFSITEIVLLISLLFV